MRVEEIDAHTASDATLLELHRIERACAPELAPGERGFTADEAIAFYRFQPTTHTTCVWLADGGFAALFVHGPTSAFAQLRVHPDHRRQGVGTALLEAVRNRCRELGVRALHGHHATAAGAAFAARAGGRDSQRVVRSVLDLANASLGDARVPDGWRLVTWLRRVPDEHLDAFVRVRGAMDDAPSPEELEFPAWTAETVRASEASLAARKREMRVTVALRSDGEIGAFTELRVSEASTAGFTDDTGTAVPHRRQGLARAVKTESLQRLREDHPEIEIVTTSNAEENAVMRHINESVGFRPTVTLTMTTVQP